MILFYYKQNLVNSILRFLLLCTTFLPSYMETFTIFTTATALQQPIPATSQSCIPMNAH